MTKITEEMNKSHGTSELDYLKKFAKQMLKSSLFTGTFQEKRFIDSLNSYRDIITIAPEEKDFIKNLMAVKKRIERSLLKMPWVGITEPNDIGTPAGYNLWVILPEEVFGKYWYKVKTVEFIGISEVRLKLDIIRPVKQENSCLSNLFSEETGKDNFNNVSIEQIWQLSKENLLYFYTHILTFKNIKNTVIFISVLISTIIAGGINIIKYLLQYLLKLISEISGLVKAITPIIINCSNVIGKLIFGFYHLIVVLFHGKPQPQPVYNAYINMDPQQNILPDPRERYNKYFPNNLPYYPTRSRATLRPIDNSL